VKFSACSLGSFCLRSRRVFLGCLPCGCTRRFGRRTRKVRGVREAQINVRLSALVKTSVMADKERANWVPYSKWCAQQKSGSLAKNSGRRCIPLRSSLLLPSPALLHPACYCAALLAPHQRAAGGCRARAGPGGPTRAAAEQRFRRAGRGLAHRPGGLRARRAPWLAACTACAAAPYPSLINPIFGGS